MWEGTEAKIFEVRERDEVGMRRVKAPFKLELLNLSATALKVSGKPYQPAPGVLPDPGRILAISDIHGRFDAALALLKAQKVVDADLRWSFGKGHLVIAGDVFDRGPQVTETLWFLRSLEEAAHRAGGAVHLLLGNHETMVMLGDHRYLHPKYRRAPEGLPPYLALYGADSELGRWLRSRATLLKLGPFLFAHGGPSPAFQGQGWKLAATNQGVRQVLGRSPAQGTPEEAFLLGSEGPLWYRGLVPDSPQPPASSEHVDMVLRSFGVKAIVIGHTTMESLTSFHGGRVYAIDAGFKEGRAGEAWIWEKGRVWRGTSDGKRQPFDP